MREIIDKVTCDICGRTKTTPYLFAGVAAEIPRVTLRTATDVVMNENDFFELRPTKHMCGKCLNVVRAAAKPA